MVEGIALIKWDSKIGPYIVEKYPDTLKISDEDAVPIFMAHGNQLKEGIGAIKINEYYVITYLKMPNCISIFTNSIWEQGRIIEALNDFIKEMNLSEIDTKSELKSFMNTIINYIKTTNIDEALNDPKVQKIIQKLKIGDKTIRPKIKAIMTLDYETLRHIEDLNELEIIPMLRKLINLGILEEDKGPAILACPECDSTNLRPVLICNNCKSTNIVKSLIIEHYACGYSGELSEFKKENKMICPRCGMELSQHDHSKPMKLYKCLDCGIIAESMIPGVECTDCGAKRGIFELKIKRIKTYKLSSNI